MGVSEGERETDGEKGGPASLGWKGQSSQGPFARDERVLWHREALTIFRFRLECVPTVRSENRRKRARARERAFGNLLRHSSRKYLPYDRTDE